MHKLVRQLGKDSLVYGVGGAAAKGIGFFLLPVFTRIFSTTDYGRIEMAMLISTLIAAVLDTGMDSSQSFYFYEQKPEGPRQQARVVSSIAQWRLTGGAAVVLIAILCVPLMNAALFDGALSWRHFLAVLVGSWFLQFMVQSAELFRLLYRPWSYIGITLSNTLIFAVLAVVFTLVFKMGIFGYFLAFLLGAMISAVIGWWAVRDYIDFSGWHTDWWPRILKFGVPLVPASVAMYVLNSADRWMINYYHGGSSLGVFAVGARFAGVLMALVLTFRQALWPIIMDVIQTDEGPIFLRHAARLYVGATAAGVVLLTAVAPFVVRLFVAPAFAGAYPLVGILAWEAVFFGLYLIISAGIWKTEKTAWVPLFMIVAVVVNIGLGVFLIPRYGNIGAAAAAATAFFVWNALTLWASERLWPVRYPAGLFLLQIGVAVASSVWLLHLQERSAPIWEIAATTAGGVAVVIATTLRRDEVEWIGRTLRSARLAPMERA